MHYLTIFLKAVLNIMQQKASVFLYLSFTLPTLTRRTTNLRKLEQQYIHSLSVVFVHNSVRLGIFTAFTAFLVPSKHPAPTRSQDIPCHAQRQ